MAIFFCIPLCSLFGNDLPLHDHYMFPCLLNPIQVSAMMKQIKKYFLGFKLEVIQNIMIIHTETN
jgi:hypothetical protein